MTEDTKVKVFSVIIIFFMLSVLFSVTKIMMRNRQMINRVNGKAVKVNEIFTLKKNETAILNDRTNVKIKLLQILDSRCNGQDMACEWEGELRYSLIINNEAYSISTVINKVLKYNNYKFIIAEEKCNEKEITLKIIKE